jgi:hypothetical protein
MTEHDIHDPIAAGLRAWLAGDLDGLAAVLDPQVSCAGSSRVRGTAAAVNR